MLNRSSLNRQWIACITACSFVATAQALTNVAGGSLTVSASANYTYESNVFANSAQSDDHTFSFQPRIAYQREKGLIHMTGSLGLDTMTFEKFDGQDFANFKSGVLFTFPNEPGNPLSASISGGYNQQSIADETVGDRVQSDTISLGSGATYRMNEKYSVSGNFAATQQSYDSSIYSDQTTFSTGAGIAYNYSEKLDLSANYRFRFTDVDANATAATAKDHAFFAQAVGQVLPKTKATVGVGAQFRDYDNDNLYSDKWAPYVSAELSWAARSTVNLSLTATHDFATTAANQTVSKTTVAIDGTVTLWEKNTLGAGIFAENANYEEPVQRKDEAWGLRGAFSRKLNDHISVYASASYSNRDSNLAQSSFEKHTFSIGITTTY